MQSRVVSAIALASVAAIGFVGACLRKTEFHCNTSDQCGAGNTCESTGYCSYADTECQRYTESAGELAGQCVGAAGTDGGIDAPIVDGNGEIDAPNAGCPNGFDTLPGVSGDHRYRVITVTNQWQQQRDACTVFSPSAYLAIPDDPAEMAALGTAAGVPFWVGISDPTEGQYVNVKGQPQTFLPWAGGEPDDSPGDADCVNGAGTTISDDRCSTRYRAVCECEP